MNSTNSTESQQSHIGGSAEEKNNNHYSIEQIENTPFSIARRPDEKLLIIGDKKITILETEADVKKMISRVKKTDWELLIPIIKLVTETLNKI